MNEPGRVGKAATYLGYAGLAPPLLMLASVGLDPTARWIVLAAGFGYAAVIFSFLGGIWWGLALSSQTSPRWVWFAAVTPSLVSFLLFVPWIFGWEWPRPSMIVLTILIAASPLMDRAMFKPSQLPTGWLSLRVRLSIGLACLTLILSQV